MGLISSVFSQLDSQWAVFALIAGIGLAVIVLRGVIRLVIRMALIGAVGFILLGALYYLANAFHFSL